MADKTVDKAATKEQPATEAVPTAPGVAPEFRVVAAPGGEGDPDGKGTHANGTDPDVPADAATTTADEINQRIRDGIPETPRPAKGTVLLETPGGYAVHPAGVAPEQVGVNAVSR